MQKKITIFKLRFCGKLKTLKSIIHSQIVKNAT